MKIKKTIIYLLFLVLLLLLPDSCVTDKMAYLPTAGEEIYGTWINEKQGTQKIIMFPNGTWETYTYATDIFPKNWGTFELYRKWKDNQGNIWYYEYVTYEGYAGSKQYSQELDMIYRDGKVWVWEYEYESILSFDPDKFITKVDPESVRYYIFYRYAEH